jgi:hypothetical protein
VKLNDPPEAVAMELVISNGWAPSTIKEASDMAYQNCDHYSIAKIAEIICALVEIRKEDDARQARAKAALKDERYRHEHPYWDHPAFGTWG